MDSEGLDEWTDGVSICLKRVPATDRSEGGKES